MTRRPIVSMGVPLDTARWRAHHTNVEHHKLPDRPLVSIGPDSDCWAEGLLPLAELSEGIVWVKPRPGVAPDLLQRLLAALKEKGARVKLLPPDRVDAIVTEARPEPAAELGLQDARAAVYQL